MKEIYTIPINVMELEDDCHYISQHEILPVPKVTNIMFIILPEKTFQTSTLTMKTFYYTLCF